MLPFHIEVWKASDVFMARSTRLSSKRATTLFLAKVPIDGQCNKIPSVFALDDCSARRLREACEAHAHCACSTVLDLTALSCVCGQPLNIAARRYPQRDTRFNGGGNAFAPRRPRSYSSLLRGSRTRPAAQDSKLQLGRLLFSWSSTGVLLP